MQFYLFKGCRPCRRPRFSGPAFPPLVGNAYNDVVARFKAIVAENIPTTCVTDAERLQELARRGWRTQPASAHGANNCLIDALLLTLAAHELLPSGLGPTPDAVPQRAAICAACRQHLAETMDRNLAGSEFFTPYLDAMQHGPKIVKYLLEQHGAATVVMCRSIEIEVYTRFDSNVETTITTVEVLLNQQGTQTKTLRVYSHTMTNGMGYHFDALLPTSVCLRPQNREQTNTNGEVPIYETNWELLHGLFVSLLGSAACAQNILSSCVSQEILTPLKSDMSHREAETAVQLVLAVHHYKTKTCFPHDAKTLQRLQEEGWQRQWVPPNHNSNNLVECLALGLVMHGLCDPSLTSDASTIQVATVCANVRTSLYQDTASETVLRRKCRLGPFLSMSSYGAVALQLLFKALNPREHHRPAVELRLYSSTEEETSDVQYRSQSITIPSDGIGDLITHVLCFYKFTLPSETSYYYDMLTPSSQTVEPRSVTLSHAVNASSKGVSLNSHTYKDSAANQPPAGELQQPAPNHVSNQPENFSSAPENCLRNAHAAVLDRSIKSGWHAHNTPKLNKVKQTLQRFCNQRGVQVHVTDTDARAIQAVWADRDNTGLTVHTLLQAGLAYADAGMHNARRLANQWRGFYTTCNQGEGTRLNSTDGHGVPPPCPSAFPRPCRRVRQKGPTPTAPTDSATAINNLTPQNKVDEAKGPRLMAPTESATAINNPISQTNVDDEAEIGNIFPLRVRLPDDGNEDPRALRDCDIRRAADLLTASPTLPAFMTTTKAREGAYDLPAYHCAFRACEFTCSQQDALEQHLVQTHQSVLLPLSLHPHVTHFTIAQALYHTYLEILQYRCQQLAPIANCAIDRRCLRQFRASIGEEDLCAAVCFVCARRFPHVPGSPNPLITWVRGYDPKRCLVLGQTALKLEEILGWNTFEQRYIAPLAEGTKAALRFQENSWKCHLLCPGYTLTLLACPEDKRCTRTRPCRPDHMCAWCDVPICHTCRRSLYTQTCKPTEALTNNLLLGHPPRELYVQECTALELLCASPCMTALTCYSIEWRYLRDRSLAQDAFMNRHRLCAKGNATTFPMGRFTCGTRATGFDHCCCCTVQVTSYWRRIARESRRFD